MEVWVIIDGARRGPFSDYEIRGKLRGGELNGDVPAWFQGLDGWRPLREIEVLRPPVDEEVPVIPGLEADEPDREWFANRPPPLPPRMFLGRRFWARWFDLQWYMAIFWLALRIGGVDLVEALKSPWINIVMLVPWFLVEAVLLNRFDTTPGKALMGLRVRNLDDSELTIGQALRRSLRVWINGVGLGWDLLCLLCQAMSWYFVRRSGRAIWDISGGHRVEEVSDYANWRLAAFILGFVAAFIFKTIVLYPAAVKLAHQLYPGMFPAS